VSEFPKVDGVRGIAGKSRELDHDLGARRAEVETDDDLTLARLTRTSILEGMLVERDACPLPSYWLSNGVVRIAISRHYRTLQYRQLTRMTATAISRDSGRTCRRPSIFDGCRSTCSRSSALIWRNFNRHPRRWLWLQ
jgi:hypothetical protein